MIGESEECGLACNRKMTFDDYSFSLEFNEGAICVDDIEPARYLYTTKVRSSLLTTPARMSKEPKLVDSDSTILMF